ncbi:MAG: hypothetical protein AABX53_01915 [Nanoarchaeota archaeon]
MTRRLFFWAVIVIFIILLALALDQRYGLIEKNPDLSPPQKGLQTNENLYAQDAIESFSEQDVASFDKATECKAPIYLSDTFPPSPVTLPPLPPPRGPYEEPNHICRHFAFEFCQDIKERYADIVCKVVFFDSHAINFLIYIDENGKTWFCYVEPQTNEYACVESTSDPVPWIQDTLCLKYYKFPPEECKDYVAILPLCEDVEGGTCTRDQSGETKSCLTGGGGGKDVNQLVCKCRYIPYEVCSWQFPVSTGTTSTR